jgi:hypothetical protein
MSMNRKPNYLVNIFETCDFPTPDGPVRNIIGSSVIVARHHNGGVDAVARIKAPFAAPSKLRKALPPLASNDLFDGGPRVP